MKGTKARVVLRSGFFQLDVLADDANDISLLLDGIGEVAGVGHGARVVRRNCEPERG